MTTSTPPLMVTPEPELNGRKLKAQMRAQDAKTKLSSPLASIIAVIIAVAWTIPTFGLLINSTRTQPGPSSSGWWHFWGQNYGFSFSNYSNAWNGNGGGAPLSDFILNTVVITLPAVFIPITLALLAAYAFAWIDFKGKNVLFIAVFAMQIVPIQVALIPLNTLYTKFGLNTSFWSIWLSHHLRPTVGDLSVAQLHEGDPRVAGRGCSGRRRRTREDLPAGAPSAAGSCHRLVRHLPVPLGLERSPGGVDLRQ